MTHSPDVPLEAPSLLNIASQSLDQEALDALEEIHLPLPVSHALFRRFRQKWNAYKTTRVAMEDPSDELQRISDMQRVIRSWCNSKRLPLTKMNLTGAVIDDNLFVDIISAHQDDITELDLTNVEGITDEANALLDSKNVYLPQLASIKLTSMELLTKPPPRRKMGMAFDVRNVLMLGEEALEEAGRGPGNRGDGFFLVIDPDQPMQQPASPVDELMEDEKDEIEREFPVFTSRCPNVQRLLLPKLKKGVEDSDLSTNEVLSRILDPLKQLDTLDLSYWTKIDDLRCIHPLHQTLTTLILYDVPDLYHAIPTITQMGELRCLDISQSQRDTAIYPRPVSTLNHIVTSLPYLTHLDISSTNLAAQPSANDWPVKSENGIRSDIVGLQSLKKPLSFLGLFNCDNAGHFCEIPAERISGDATENQVITALQMYKERAGLLQSVLNESYQLYRFGNTSPITRHTEALHLVLDAMQRHLHDSTLQIAGSASLFYIIRKVDMNRDTKKQVVSALLSGMEVHMEEQVMVRNCCLSLCQFEIPQDILFDYSRLAVLLVTVLQHHNADNLTQRIVVFLLNSMACHVEGDQKVQVGSFGAIEMIIDQIARKHNGNTCDDVMEVGWSFLWNITDETPVNCERFLNAKGLDLFQKCYESFRNERELVRNMMGLIGNIAEVDELRSQLMNDDYVKIFCALLETREDSIEISYNSAGVLAHMVSDGEEVWKPLAVSRDYVMTCIVRATASWQLDTRRFINYRSFRPILRLLPLYHAYASQHWAVWALANLTTTDGEKYCPYVRDEGGLPLLEELVRNEATTVDIRILAQKVLDNIKRTEKIKMIRASPEICCEDEPMDIEV
ncbi:unnamed protein product [Caenorhabditis bovis]|uniref:Uncharacterized protein n=1 Tax=Caenorhabditis bovis TaxID=2654633 RepID=A0A8S1EJB9_9PELO|nr:unnamed protein product [Caenorhabditis bovis]